ncbi:CDP-glycerol glycerophosphotransferase family protein [Allosphingosinicella flava]|uniref:CDP-glycerol glycerophosphotransferase family protein n=1 Tax=Allosphingosinicella flava TaxID=2771430 RepID=A0A7T2LLL3_9SPHN|nr:CDP-glycerol glycerophosphotransferase family protein [Sphingosinicella flava]QPQ54157.1 CDP-glycerol glycerophosphotransferase family protein [Sphingosinicella flava]
MKIAFLYNHDAIHQIAHTAPIVAALRAMAPEVSVSILTSTRAQEARVRLLLSSEVMASVTMTRLKPGLLQASFGWIANAVAPYRRLAVLRNNLDLLAGFDALVVPETTSAFLKTRFGVTGPKLIYLPHGAGDRSVGFREVTKAFDLVLLSGRKVRDRMLAAGLIREDGHAIVGYPKFDTVDLSARPRLFGDDKPVVLYNPHFDPKLSSWYDLGRSVLDWFAEQDRYNLIFAPHVMLFRRQLHGSVEHARLRFTGGLSEIYRRYPNIIIDTESQRSVDMTYTLSADIYLGDVSSQIYEWIARPRPAIFLNAHGAEWQGNANYAHWRLGQVIDRVEALPEALARVAERPDDHAAIQRAAFQETFSLTGERSADRAARAILDFLSRNGGAA